MVGNATLSEMYLALVMTVTIPSITDVYFTRSLKYKLPDRLILHPAQAITLRASANIQGK